MVVNNALEVVDVVQKYVDQHQPPDYRLRVLGSEATRREEDWWYVVVTPDRAGVRSHEYAERLSDIEEAIWEKEELHVLLVPTLAV